MVRVICLILILTAGFSLNAVHGKMITRTIPYQHGGVACVGFLAYDDAKTASGKLPGVLVIPEWWGLSDYPRQRARQLAELGYVALVADMYGNGLVTENKDKAKELVSAFYGKPLMAARAGAGLDQLIATGLVDPSKLAAIGFCFGGSTVQALAYSGAPLVGIVSFHGGPVPAPASVIGKIKTRFLLLNGASDPTVSVQDKAAQAESLRKAGISFQSIDYPGARHAFSNPDADRLAAVNGMTSQVGYNQSAAAESWRQMRLFLKEVFGG